MIKRCVILRSAPGAGKSSLAKKIRDEAVQNGNTVVVCSADDYFMVPVNPCDPESPREYRYDPKLIGNAHGSCRHKADDAMREGIDVVIIDNTNITSKEFSHYVYTAVCYDYDVEFVEPTTPWWLSVRPLLNGNKKENLIKPHCKVFAEKNTHGVPESTILKMLMRWESDPSVESVVGR